MTARLFDRDANVWVEVPDESVTDLVKAGTHGFEREAEVPVVAPDGRLGSIPATKVEEAFRRGFRWQTRDDSRAWEEREQRDIQQKHYGDNWGIAAAAGAMEMVTGGLSTVAMTEGAGALNKLADVLPGGADVTPTGDPTAQVREALRASIDLNPGAHLAGQVAGAVLPIAGVARGAGAVGRGITGLVGAGAATTGVKGMVQRAVASGVGGMYEGAMMGLSTGVSEAALGDPRTLGEILYEHTMSGAVFGGLAGGGFGVFGEAAPFIKQGVTKVTDWAGDALQGAAAKTFEKTARVVLSAADEAELATILKEVSAPGSLPVREAFYKGGKPLAEKVAKEIAPLEAAMRGEGKVLRQGLDAAIKKEPKAVQAQINAMVDSHAGQIDDALEEAWTAVEGHTTQLDAALAEGAGAASIFPSVDKAAERTIRALEKEKTVRGRIIAEKLSKYIKGQRAANGVTKDAAAGVLNEGGEIQIARELRRIAIDELDGAPNKGPLQNFIKTVTAEMQGHPRYGQMIREADEAHAAYDGLRRFVTGADNATTVKPKILHRIQRSPDFRAKFGEVANHFSDLMPEFKAIKEAVSETGKLERVKAFQDKVEALQAGGLRRLSTDDIIALSDEFGKADWLKNASRLKEVETVLATESVGPVDRYVRLKDALGEPVEDLARTLAPNAKTLEAIQRLEKVTGQRVDPSWLKELMVKGTKAAAGYAIGSVVGDNPATQTLGMVLGAAMSGKPMVSASTAMKTLTKVQLAARKNTQRLEKATNAVVSALTSKTAARAGVAAAAGKSSFQADRSNYKNNVGRLEWLGDFENRIDTVTKALEGLDVAPNLQAALSTQFGTVVDFLSSKMPRDPLAHKSFFGRGASSGWEPSDFELAKFQRYVAAAQDPVHTLSRLAVGDVTPEEIETLKTCYPVVFGRLQEAVMDAIMDPKVKLTYAQRMQIGTLLNVPADATLDPKFMATMQAQYAVDKGGRPAEGGGGGFSGGGASGSYRPASLDLNTQAMSSEVSRISEK